jgi:glycosyltransferase involved in cell wall biosynthesis
MLPANLAGTLAMRECGLNSEWLRALVLRHAAETLNTATLERLEQILRVQYLGVDPGEPGEPDPGLVVFNHRPNAYTGYPRAIELFDRLWERRRDFRVAFTLADPDRPWAYRVRAAGRDDYLALLRRAWVGVGLFESYSAWSVAVTDGFSVGLPYVLPAGLCYPEMVGDGYPLLYETDDGFLEKLELVLDQPALRSRLSGDALEIARSFSWRRTAEAVSSMFDRAIADAWVLKSRSSRYEEVEALALAGRTKLEITRALGWGAERPFTPYRNRLRLEGVPLP